MNAKIESAQRKMTSKIGVLKRESKEFTEASDQKPVYEITGDSTGATKATAGRMSFGAVSDITPQSSNAGLKTVSQKTPTQFGQEGVGAESRSKYLDTDEDGNRMSILPDKSRPTSSSNKD